MEGARKHFPWVSLTTLQNWERGHLIKMEGTKVKEVTHAWSGLFR